MIKKIITFTTICLGVFVISSVACTKSELTQIESDITPVGACVANIIAATTGIEDPVAIAITCSVAVSDVYLVVSELLEHNPTTLAPDASPAELVNAGAYRSKLTRIQTKAHDLLVNSNTTLPQIK
jgi:hypothetical protein